MKLEAQFELKNKKLFFTKTNKEISTDEFINFDATSLCENDLLKSLDNFCENENIQVVSIFVSQKNLLTLENNYNESYLATFRTFLKKIEQKNIYAVIVPVTCENVAINEKIFTDLICHVARRIKDCSNVIGFAIPTSLSPLATSSLIELLSIKHSHYIYFLTQSSGSTSLYIL